jgi:two-component system sensor histidine kinase KdpD
VNDLRAALLAAVSHDLRTPLASIKASVSTLRQDDIEWSDEDRTELLETIEVSADRLTELVTNLLGMSRIQAGTVELATRDVDLEEVVSRAVVGLDTRGHELKFDLEREVSAVRADAGLLERAVANVIDNALKWSPAGGSITVRSDEHGDRVVLLVVDQGPGIPVADRLRVFEPFQRSGDRPTIAGTGLGLAVARGFVELMGGEVDVEDTPGGGTTMVISLPAAR